MTRPFATGLPGGHSEWEPPDPFSNSEVKTLRADASVDFVDVKVGHCQALNTKPPTGNRRGLFYICGRYAAMAMAAQSANAIRASLNDSSVSFAWPPAAITTYCLPWS